jgi:hypothetical protein
MTSDPTPAPMSPVERFGLLLAELAQTLGAMPDDQRLHAVLANDAELIRFYLRIAELNRFFHECCESGTLPIDGPGHA